MASFKSVSILCLVFLEGNNYLEKKKIMKFGTLIEECLNIPGGNFGLLNHLALSAYYP